MALLFLATSGALILLTAVLLLAVIRPLGRPAALIGLYLISWAAIILSLELAGLLRAIRPATVVWIQILIAMAALAIWLRSGKPRLTTPFAGWSPRGFLQKRYLLQFLKQPLLVALCVLVVLVYLRNAQIIWVTPPDDADSLHYHLSRIGYWLQYETFYPWPAPNLRQTTFPMNAELGMLWTILWWNTDQLAGFVQLSTVPVVALGIFCLVRLLGYTRTQAAYVGLLWTTLTQVLYQSTTTQNDLVQSVFWVAAIFFILDWLKHGLRPSLYLSAIATGLAVGTKGTTLLLLPSLLAGLAVGLWLHRRQQAFRTRLAAWCVASAASVLLLGAYMYLQNSIAFGHPLGPPEIYAPHMGAAAVDQSASRLELLRDNTARYLYQLVDLSPLPFGLARSINPAKAAVFSPLYGALGVRLNSPRTILDAASDHIDFSTVNTRSSYGSWFGPVAVLMIPMVLWQAWRGLRRRDLARLLLAGLAVGFLLSHSAAQPWTDSKGRYYVLPVALAFPLIAPLVGSQNALRRALRAFTVCLGATAMLTISMHMSEQRHLTGSRFFALQRADPAWADEFLYNFISSNVPASAAIGAVNTVGFADYPLFGERFTRKITLELPEDASILPRGNLQRYADDLAASEYIYSGKPSLTSVSNLRPGDFEPLVIHRRESLWMRRTLRPTGACDTGSWPFSRLFRSSDSGVCLRFPIVFGLGQPEWGSRPAVAIGAGPDRGFGFDLLVDSAANLTLAVDVDAGDATAQLLRLVAVSADGHVQELAGNLQGRSRLPFVFAVTPQKYSVRLHLEDGSGTATIEKLELEVQSDQ